MGRKETILQRKAARMESSLPEGHGRGSKKVRGKQHGCVDQDLNSRKRQRKAKPA